MLTELIPDMQIKNPLELAKVHSQNSRKKHDMKIAYDNDSVIQTPLTPTTDVVYKLKTSESEHSCLMRVTSDWPHGANVALSSGGSSSGGDFHKAHGFLC